MSNAANDQMIAQARGLFESGKLRDAAALCERVLAAKRTHAGAHVLLGQIAYELQHWDRAAMSFQRAISAERRNHSYHGMLGATRVAQGRLSDALARFERALRIEPGYQDALAGKAEALEMSGKRERAIALIAPTMKSGKASPRMALAYLRAVQADGGHEEVVAAAGSQLRGPGMPDTFRRSILLILGNSLHRLGEYDRAFEAFREGNGVGAPPFDIEAVRRQFAELRESFSPDALSTLPRAAHGSELPIYVVGLPRSGTTLIEQIIQAHPSAHGIGEAHEVAVLTRRLARLIGSEQPYPRCVRDLRPDTIESVAASYLEHLAAHAPGAVRIVDKSLENYECLGLIALLAPNARVIHARREAMDVCFSCYIQDLWPKQHPHTSDLANLGHYYREYDGLMRYWGETLDVPILDVHYEEMVEDADAQGRRIVEFVGLEWDDACARFHEAKRDVATISYDQVRQPIYRTAKGRYRYYEGHLGPLREALGDLVGAASPESEDAD